MGKKIVIVDYQLGNLFSVNQALLNIGMEVKVSTSGQDIDDADAIVLPGVGAFKDAMENLDHLQLREPILNAVNNGKPFFGICLGLQLLFTESEEFGSTKGLGLVPGMVKKFENSDVDGNKVRVPQIAWNSIYQPSSKSWADTPFQSIESGSDMYFVHSYYVVPNASEVALSETKYHDKVYASSIMERNIFACQFHPEKSADKGITIYKNWASLNNLQ
jgi:glutamine amidotransferase